MHFHTVIAVLWNNKIHPKVSTVPRQPIFPIIVVHLCCSRGTDLLAVQPILLWLSERVLQSEVPTVTTVVALWTCTAVWSADSHNCCGSLNVYCSLKCRQSQLLWLSERVLQSEVPTVTTVVALWTVLQSEVPTVTLVISGTKQTVILFVAYFPFSYKASSLFTQAHNCNSSYCSSHYIQLRNKNILIRLLVIIIIAVYVQKVR